MLAKEFKIAVIGLGPAGLCALKSLKEEGFEVTGFERRASVGGIWSRDSSPSQTSVMEETVANISKFVSAFSDYTLPASYPPYLHGFQVQEYLNNYAIHFDLVQHCNFHTSVSKVTRNSTDANWNVHIVRDGQMKTLRFDKVVFATGSESVPKWPPLPNRDAFRGTVLHAREFQHPERFAGQSVMVVGLGNTACDAAIALSKHCSHVYQSYRRGRLVISRYLDNGVPMDTTISWPASRLKYLLEFYFSRLVNALVSKVMAAKMISDASRHQARDAPASKSAAHKVSKDWRLIPFAGLAYENPTAQEHWFETVDGGSIQVVQGFDSFESASTVKLTDGRVIDVDAVIFCTGYKYDLSTMPDLELGGSGGLPMYRAASVSWDDKQSVSTGKEGDTTHLPRLYNMIFPPQYASSIAFLGYMKPQEAAWTVGELASMAITQIWAEHAHSCKGPNETHTPAMLPAIEDMNKEIDKYHDWWKSKRAQQPSMQRGFVQAYPFYKFLHEKAGTGMYSLLDHMFTFRGWKLWYNDRELYQWLSNGPMNSHAWRLLDTNPQRLPGRGRKPWFGARAAISDVHHEFEIFKQSLKPGTS